VDGLYIIEAGWAKVTKASESGETEAVLEILQPGSCFGEIGLIDGLPRTAIMRAAAMRRPGILRTIAPPRLWSAPLRKRMPESSGYLDTAWPSRSRSYPSRKKC